MTPGNWAAKFVGDILYESNEDQHGEHSCSLSKSRETAIRHFGVEIRRLERKLVHVYRQGQEDGFVKHYRIRK